MHKNTRNIQFESNTKEKRNEATVLKGTLQLTGSDRCKESACMLDKFPRFFSILLHSIIYLIPLKRKAWLSKALPKEQRLRQRECALSTKEGKLISLRDIPLALRTRGEHESQHHRHWINGNRSFFLIRMRLNVKNFP